MDIVLKEGKYSHVREREEAGKNLIENPTQTYEPDSAISLNFLLPHPRWKVAND